MERKPLFSVLIANYNNGPFLKDAINSVLAQSYDNWEIIFVDDCSSDNSAEVLEKYKDDHRIRIYTNSHNYGCGYTKRRCVELANGSICGFLDADDALQADAISSHIEVHLSNTDLGCLFSRYYWCDERLNNQSISRLLQIPNGKSYFTYGDYSPEHFVSFKTSFYKKTEGIAGDLKKGVDQDLYFKLEEVSKLMVLDKVTYKYRFHNNSISHVSNDAFYWNLIVRHRTCLRRGLNPEDYPIRDFNEYVQAAIDYQRQAILHSRSYKLGAALLRPFLFFLHR